MYPCQWAAERDVNPRTSFERANMVAELPVKHIHDSWPFPDSDDLPKNVKPALLLEHELLDPILFVDLDGIRDPQTGETLTEAVDLLYRLGGYAEISASGTGIHTFVRGSLPDGSFSMGLGEFGRVEIYEQSRFVANTWNHIEETPFDDIPQEHDLASQFHSRSAFYKSTKLI